MPVSLVKIHGRSTESGISRQDQSVDHMQPLETTIDALCVSTVTAGDMEEVCTDCFPSG